MNRFGLLHVAVGFIATLSPNLVDAQDDTARDNTLRFVAEFRVGANGSGDSMSLDVTFYGARPDAGTAEETLRNCMKAAIGMHPVNNIVGKAWHERVSGDKLRQTVKLTGGDSLLYVALDKAIRFHGGGVAQPAANTEQVGGDLSWITQNPNVVGACEGSQQEHVALISNAAAQNQGLKRRLILKAMKAWCKDNNVPVDRKLRTCMKAIAKTAASGRPTSIAVVLPEDLPAAIAHGEDAYRIGMCGKCHRANGRGGPRAPDLTDDKWLHCDGEIQGIRRVLVSGVPESKLKDPNRPFGMNTVKNLIPDDQQITDLAIYVHSLSQK